MRNEDSVSKNPDATSNPSHPRSLSRRQLMLAGGAAATAVHHRAATRAGRGGICRAQREDHPGLHRLRDSGDPGNRRHTRQPGRADRRRVRRREGRGQLPGMGQEPDPGRNQAAHREPDLERRLQPRARRPRCRQGDRGNLLREAARQGAITRDAPPTRTSASCWKRRRM